MFDYIKMHFEEREKKRTCVCVYRLVCTFLYAYLYGSCASRYFNINTQFIIICPLASSIL